MTSLNPYEPPQIPQTIVTTAAQRPPHAIALYINPAKHIVAVNDADAEIYQFRRRRNLLLDFIAFIAAFLSFFLVLFTTPLILEGIGHLLAKSEFLQSLNSTDSLPSYIITGISITLILAIPIVVALTTFRIVSPRFRFAVYSSSFSKAPLLTIRRAHFSTRLKQLVVFNQAGSKVAVIHSEPKAYHLEFLGSGPFANIRLTIQDDRTFSLNAKSQDQPSVSNLGHAHFQDGLLLFHPQVVEIPSVEQMQLTLSLLVIAFITPDKYRLFIS